MLTLRVRLGAAIAAIIFSSLFLAFWPQPAIDSPAVESTALLPRIENYRADGSARPLLIARPPSRVVVTHPAATELLLELGLGDRILATVAPYGEPLPRLASSYAALPKLAAPFVPSREEMYVLEPDLIIGWPHHFAANELGDADFWQRRGALAYILPGSLPRGADWERAVYGTIDDFGVLFSIRDKTDRYIAALHARITAVQTALRAPLPAKTVLIVQAHGNGRFSLYDRTQLISRLAELAGATNVAVRPANFVGAEDVLAYDPEYLIYVTLPQNGRDLTPDEALAEAQSLVELRNLGALKNRRVVALPFFTVNSGGIRSVDAVETLAHALHPDRFLPQR